MLNFVTFGLILVKIGALIRTEMPKTVPTVADDQNLGVLNHYKRYSNLYAKFCNLKIYINLDKRAHTTRNTKKKRFLALLVIRIWVYFSIIKGMANVVLNFVTLRLILFKISAFIRTETPKKQFPMLQMIKIWVYFSIIIGTATFRLNFTILRFILIKISVFIRTGIPKNIFYCCWRLKFWVCNVYFSIHGTNISWKLKYPLLRYYFIACIYPPSFLLSLSTGISLLVSLGQ